ncbi:MAG: hypothetical protein RL637_662 [Pseudomonadota bacterium]|jgi:chemosensory pili system protein ChpA (sensor histidine kinase/response regulator)
MLLTQSVSQSQFPSSIASLSVLFAQAEHYLEQLGDCLNANHIVAIKTNYIQTWLTLSSQIESQEANENTAILSNVLLLFIDNAEILINETDFLNDAEYYQLLTTWHRIFQSYLTTLKANPIQQLIEQLTNPLFPLAITEEDAHLLSSSLIIETEQVAESTVEIASFSQWQNTNQTLNPIDEIENRDSLLIDEIEETIYANNSPCLPWADIKPLFEQSDFYLNALIDAQLTNNSVAFNFNVQDYITSWEDISSILITDDYAESLYCVVELFVHFCQQSLADLATFSDAQLAILHKWQHLFAHHCRAYPNQQFAAALVHCLTDAIWSEPIDADTEAQFCADLAPKTSASEAPINVTDTDHFEAEKIYQIIWSAIELFFLDADEQINQLQSLIDDNSPLIAPEHLQHYAHQWLVIADIIAEKCPEYSLAQISFIFADNCWQLAEQNQIFIESIIDQLGQWHLLFKEFLQDILDLTLFNQLIECLQRDIWLQPLTIEDRGFLLAIMDEERQQWQSWIIADNQAEIPATFIETDLLENIDTIIEASDEDLIEVDLNETLIASDPYPLVTAETIIEEQPIIAETVTIDDQLWFEDSLNLPSLTINPEFVQMIRDQFNIVTDKFNQDFNTIAQFSEFKNKLATYQVEIENLARASNTIGLIGLEQVFDQILLNITAIFETDILESYQTLISGLIHLFNLIKNYLIDFTLNSATELVEHLNQDWWLSALNPHDNQTLIQLLIEIELSKQTESVEPRKAVAEFSDISLALPQDVNQELLDSLLSELPDLTGNFSSVIIQIISGNSEVAQLLNAQRIAHTLKGAGNIVGVGGIAILTHHLEEILEYLTEQQQFPNQALSKVLLEAADCLEMMGELLLNGQNYDSSQATQALHVLQDVLNWSNRIAQYGLTAEEVCSPTELVSPSVEIAAPLPKTNESAVTIRVASELVDTILRINGESSILNEQFKDRIKNFAEQLKNLNELTWQMQSLVSELDQAITIQSYQVKTYKIGEETKFDSLEMEQYNELHTSASRIAEVATDIREININMDEQLGELKYLMIEQEVIHKENQEMLHSIRMVPAQTIASRCHRIVRQACRTTNKTVELEIKGAEVLIDSKILDDMVEPLMHLLRNCVDHGIESAELREQYGKNKVGKILLEFTRKGNYAVIRCQDDGAGLSSELIKQTAIRKGLLSAEQILTEAEIHKLILIPGFSTREFATQTSGRGIGMDVIQSKISSIQGQMNLYSVSGQGLAIEMTIPLTLSSMLSLLVKCGGQTLAISNRGLRKIYHADECKLVYLDQELYCEINQQKFPALYFSQLLGMPLSYELNQHLPALKIEDEIEKTHIVLVDELLGYRDLLVKNMGHYIAHIQGISGASILGNGDVAPVIDLVEMLRHNHKYQYLSAIATQNLADNLNNLPWALIIDDSLSARRAVATLVKDLGLRVETAIDGLDAIKHLDQSLPNIIIVDLEMPRMNGIDFTTHIRGRDNMQLIPILMITSRATEKHRKRAQIAGVTEFMTKPFSEDDLIMTIKNLLENQIVIH